MSTEATVPTHPRIEAVGAKNMPPRANLDLRRALCAVNFLRYGPSRKVYMWYLTTR